MICLLQFNHSLLISVSFDFFKPLIKKNKSFAVQTSRTGNHSFKSIDINKKLGELIQKEFSLEVNLENPEQIVEIEIIDKRLFLIKESLPCIQGFPVGTAPPAALLLEGNENDLLSGLLMLSKGSKIFPIFNDKTKIPKNHLTPLEKFNNFNSFSPTSFSELKQLAEKEKLKAIALSDSKLKEENFLQELLVIKPLDFLPERKFLQLRDISRRISASPVYVKKELNNLSKLGLIDFEKKGNLSLFSLKEDCIIFK